MKQRILIFYTSVGLGHKSIAENLGWHLEHNGYEVKLADILQVQKGSMVDFGTSLHRFINTSLPFLWKWLYLYGHYIFLRFRMFTASKNYNAAKEVIDQFQPDLVVTTQTSASAILEYLKTKKFYTKLWAVAFSDYHLHKFWLYPSVDFYLANIEEQKQAMIKLVIPAEKIFVCGMTMKPKPVVNAGEARKKLGLLPNDKAVLLGSGSLGTGLSIEWIVRLSEELSRKDATARLVVVCGKNLKFYENLKTATLGTSAIVLGYYIPMAELYAVADLFLTKPGGLTVAESLQWNLPMLITHWLPGQEEINYRYLIKKGLIMQKPISMEPSSLAKVILHQLNTGEFRKELEANPNVIQVTQNGQEGQVVLKALETMFHNV